MATGIHASEDAHLHEIRKSPLVGDEKAGHGEIQVVPFTAFAVHKRFPTRTCLTIFAVVCILSFFFILSLEDASSLPWPGPSSLWRPIHKHPACPMSSKEPTPNLTLAPLTFHPLPLGSIRPLGWIHDQMRLMSAGLAGHQYDFYHIVKHSPWLGGHSEYSPLNEGLPYWFNGLVPLAYGLNDSRLIKQVRDASDYVIDHQAADGWLGPETGADRDIWGRFPFMLGLYQQAEADASRAVKIVTAMMSFVRLMHRMLLEGVGMGQIWGQVRYPDMLLVLQWLYQHHPKENASVLLETMFLLKQNGKDWTAYWTEENFIFADLDLVKPAINADSPLFPFVHGVNAVQGLKAGAAIHRFTFNESLIQTSRKAVNWTLAYHGDPAGSVIGDERLSGLGPNRGSELCTSVELMFSLIYLYQTIADDEFADRCELAAFNALPVSINGDHWARQYLALPNEPVADQLDGATNFWNVGGYGLIYGLEPNYPCCTVNMPQGLPKYLSASFVRTGSDGIGHALLGPAGVSTTTASGTAVTITCNTTYPFGSNLHYKVTSAAPFTLYLRVPSWYTADDSFIELNGNSARYPLDPNARTGMTVVHLPAGVSTVRYTLGSRIRVEDRGNDSVAIYRGALLYALDVGQATTSLPVSLYNASVTYPTADYPIDISTARSEMPARVHDVAYTNTRPWNIAIDPSTLQYHSSVNGTSPTTLKNPIFDYQAPPNYITGKGCQIYWPLHNGVPRAPPKLQKGSEWACVGNITEVVLRPYGSLKVHMAELPVVDLRL